MPVYGSGSASGPPKKKRVRVVSTPTAILGSKGQPKAARRPTTPSTPASRRSSASSTRASSRSGRSRRILSQTYPGLDAEQTRTLETVLNVGRKTGATRQESKSAVETGLVESNLRNLPGGDADSSGWRQERASIYGTGRKGPQNVRASARRYFSEARSMGGRATAGQLAADVQRPAEQYRGRYDERRREAGALLRTYAKKAKASGEKKVFTKVGLKGPYEGSKRAIRQIIGKRTARTEDWKDKEEGHSPTGDHDPSQPSAYAADLPHDQELLGRINKKLGTKLKLGQDATVNYKGYRVQVITSPHGTGPHIHVGARLGTGSTSLGGSAFDGGSAASGTGGFAGTASGGQERTRGRRDRRRKQLLEEIISRSVYEPTVRVKQAAKTPVRKKPVRLGL